MMHTPDKNKFYIQVYTAEEFYSQYDNPADNFKDLVMQDKDYFHPTSDSYNRARKEKRVFHSVVFTRDTNTAISHVGMQPLNTSIGKVLYIFHVFTLEPYRRQGLVKYALHSLQKQGMKLGLRTASDNYKAITLWESLGFHLSDTGVYTTENDTELEYIWENNSSN